MSGSPRPPNESRAILDELKRASGAHGVMAAASGFLLFVDGLAKLATAASAPAAPSPAPSPDEATVYRAAVSALTQLAKSRSGDEPMPAASALGAGGLVVAGLYARSLESMLNAFRDYERLRASHGEISAEVLAAARARLARLAGPVIARLAELLLDQVRAVLEAHVASAVAQAAAMPARWTALVEAVAGSSIGPTPPALVALQDLRTQVDRLVWSLGRGGSPGPDPSAPAKG